MAIASIRRGFSPPMAIASVRRRLGVATVKAQAGSLLGRLQMVCPGTNAAVGRRRHAQELKRQWAREEGNGVGLQAGVPCLQNGFCNA